MLCESVSLWSQAQHGPGKCNVSDQSGSLPVPYKYTRLLFTSVTFTQRAKAQIYTLILGGIKALFLSVR